MVRCFSCKFVTNIKKCIMLAMPPMHHAKKKYPYHILMIYSQHPISKASTLPNPNSSKYSNRKLISKERGYIRLYVLEKKRLMLKSICSIIALIVSSTLWR